MTDETIEQKRARYVALAHAMQAGVALEMNYPEMSHATDPKHLRVGVNVAMVDHSALVTLLLDKGLLTEAEYYDALIVAMEKEVRLYEQRISEHLGGKTDIHLV